mgnify:FL=1
MTLDLTALRKLLADYRAFDASDTVGDNDGSPLAECQSWSLLADALLSNAEALIRAADERDALLAACGAKDDLLACYRLGKRPSAAVFKRLDKASEAIRLAKEPR